MKRKNIVEQIEALKKLPLTKKPPFFASEYREILEHYAPDYPKSINSNQIFELCTAIFGYGYIKGRDYEARKRRQNARKATEQAQ